MAGFQKNRHIFHNHIFYNHDFANQIFQANQILQDLKWSLMSKFYNNASFITIQTHHSSNIHLSSEIIIKYFILHLFVSHALAHFQYNSYNSVFYLFVINCENWKQFLSKYEGWKKAELIWLWKFEKGDLDGVHGWQTRTSM